MLGLPFLRGKILRINYEHPSVEILELMRLTKSFTGYEIGVPLIYGAMMVVERDIYLALKVTIDIFIFMLMVSLIFVTTIGFDKFFNEEEEEKEEGSSRTIES